MEPQQCMTPAKRRLSCRRVGVRQPADSNQTSQTASRPAFASTVAAASARRVLLLYALCASCLSLLTLVPSHTSSSSSIRCNLSLCSAPIASRCASVLLLPRVHLFYSSPERCTCVRPLQTCCQPGQPSGTVDFLCGCCKQPSECLDIHGGCIRPLCGQPRRPLNH